MYCSSLDTSFLLCLSFIISKKYAVVGFTGLPQSQLELLTAALWQFPRYDARQLYGLLATRANSQRYGLCTREYQREQVGWIMMALVVAGQYQSKYFVSDTNLSQ